VRGHVGEDMKIGLAKLTSILAAVPNVDYRAEGVPLTNLGVVELPAENLLSVSAGAIERNNEAIKRSMRSNSEWIKRTMDANDLVAAGPMRIVSTELGRENYTFDVVQPVRRKGSDEANAANGGDEAEAEAEAMAQAPAVDEGELEVEIPEGAPVEYIRTEPGRFAHGEYKGYMAELENVRNAVRAWALTHGHEVTDRPVEFYKNGIDNAFTADGEFEEFWRLRESSAPPCLRSPRAASPRGCGALRSGGARGEGGARTAGALAARQGRADGRRRGRAGRVCVPCRRRRGPCRAAGRGG